MNKIGLTIRWYLSIVGFLYTVIFTAVTAFSFNISTPFVCALTIIALIMVGLSTMTLPFIDKSILPIIPSKRFWMWILILAGTLNGAYLFFGENMMTSVGEKNEAYWEKESAALDKSTLSEKIYLVKDCVYYREDLSVDGKITTEREVLFKKKVSLDSANEKMVLIVFKNKYNTFVNGYEAYVPISCLKKKRENEVTTTSSGKSDGSSILSSLKSAFNKAPVEVSLSSEQVVLRDLHKTPDKLMLSFAEFKKGDMVELSEDFSLRVTGHNPQTWIAVGGVSDNISIVGNAVVLKKGTRYVFLDEYINFGITSTGNQFDFSGLELLFIKNIL